MTGALTGRRVSRAAAGLAVTAGLAVAACGTLPNPVGPKARPATSSPGGPAHAVTASRPIAPLTGLPAASPADAARPAVALVVAGTSPQGLTAADLVYEEITSPVRYIAVYQSRQATGVGPITATQPTDREALQPLHPLIGYNGAAAPFFVTTLGTAKIIDASYTRYPSLYVAGAAGLTTSTQAISRAVRGGATPPPLFSYRSSAGSALASSGVSRPARVSVTLPGLGTQAWTFDHRTSRWVLASGGPAVQVANLIIEWVSYRQILAHHVPLSTAQMTGTGRAEAFSGSLAGGTAATGTWSKPGNSDLTNYFDSRGTPMAFQPGPTWVILAPPGTQAAAS